MTPSPDVTSVLHASYHDLTVTDRIVIDNPCGDRCGGLLEVVWGSSLSSVGAHGRARLTVATAYRRIYDEL